MTEAAANPPAPMDPPRPAMPAAAPQHAGQHVPQYAPQYGAPPMMQVAPKNAAVALIVSFFIPGVGTMMNGQTGKGIGILVGYFISWILCFVLIGIPFLFGFWIWGMVDAYTGANKWNAAHGIVS